MSLTNYRLRLLTTPRSGEGLRVDGKSVVNGAPFCYIDLHLSGLFVSLSLLLCLSASGFFIPFALSELIENERLTENKI